MSRSSIPRALRREVQRRDADRCLYCGLLQVGQGATFHVDHVLPRSRGGATSLDNLVLQCPYCSLHKADRTHAKDPDTGEELPLFHPLRQRWEDHFHLEPDATITGVSGIGRATVAALRMNDSIPLLARRCEMALGLFGV
jgi:5-methylcytosine-specific restriction endonuclease McrA